MSFFDVAKTAFTSGPVNVRGFAKFARYFVMISLFVAYFGSCSVCVIIMAENAQQMYEYYTDNIIGIRVSILLFLLPLILVSSIRNLKFLTPFSNLWWQIYALQFLWA